MSIIDLVDWYLMDFRSQIRRLDSARDESGKFYWFDRHSKGG